MAKAGSPDVKQLIIGGRSILGEITEIRGPEIEAILEETTVLGLDWPTHDAVGMQKAMISFSGFYDDRAGGMNATLIEGLASTFRVGLVVIRSKMTGFAGLATGKFSRKPVKNELVKAEGTLIVTGNVDDGDVLQALAAQTADWNTQAASVDNGASSANGGAAYLAVTALTGFTGFVGKVRHSPDNATFADLATFANITAAPAAQRVAVAAGTTVERYLAFDGNVTGSGSITAVAGFSRG